MAQPNLLTATARRSEREGFGDCCPENAYLQLAIPDNFANVRSITINVTSHDQGFCDNPDQGSWSWVHARVVTPEGRDRKRWHVFYNRIANLEPFTQTSTFPRDEHDKHVLRSFRANDTIQIIPRAQWLAWRNFVLSAEIEVVGEELEESLTRMQQRSENITKAIYSTLDQAQSEIRILTLFPGPPGSGIECEMEQASLDSSACPSFEALSYCWGDARDCKTISVMGQAFPVTLNLHEALCRLRYNEGVRLLWVDALCINQEDKDERAWQVQIMKTIYTTASHVTVWLGELEELVGPDCQLQLREKFLDRVISDDELQPLLDSTHLASPELLGKNMPDPGDCWPLFETPWFARVWVLQEVFNAQKIRVLCGDLVLSWPSILHMNAIVHRESSSKFGNYRTYRKTMPALFSGIFGLAVAPQIQPDATSNCLGYVHQHPTTNVLEIMIAGLDLAATDPRDKLFALFSFMPPSTDPALQPDYNKDVADVFCDFTRWWIQSHRSLRILSAIHCSVNRTWHKLSPLPSSPLSTKRPTWSLWYDGKSAWAQATLGLSPLGTYRASGDTVPDATLLAESTGNTLLLKGKAVAAIRSIAPFPYYQTFQPDSQLTPYRRIYEALFDPCGYNLTFKDGSPSPQDVMSLYQPTPEAGMNHVADHFYTHRAFAENSGGAIECHPNSLFTTNTGLRGLCPCTAQEGDTIVMLYGGKVPYLVRSPDGSAGPLLDSDGSPRRRVEFVGECYLPGYMDGEAVSDPQLETEVFELI